MTDTPKPASLVHADAVALTAMRPVDGVARFYSIAEADSGRRAIVALFRQAQACGFIKPSSTEPSYAVLDVLDANDDIVQDWNIPTATAWRWWYRKLHLRVDHGDVVTAGGVR
jgi:hypothetical protein